MRLEPITGTSTCKLRSPGLELPPELLGQAVRRLSGLSVISGVSAIVFYALNGLLQPEVASLQDHLIVRLVTLAMVLSSLAFFVLHRSGLCSPRVIVNLGVLLQVVVSFFIAMTETSAPFGSHEFARGVSAVALWIALCGLLIPSTPVMNLVAGLSVAAMWPLAYFVNAEIHNHAWIGWNRVAAWCFPLLLTALWSNLINRRIYRIEVDAHRATEMGSYELQTLIGRGGMGEVWRAHHKMLARDAAVKIIRPEVLAAHSGRDAEVLKRRFEREARATAQLRSPHTVALYDFGTSKDQSFYYVMELLEGADLQTLVERHGPMPPGRVVNILIQACESLEEAHRRGMVHRDIKPRNILLCKLGLQFDFVKVLDFGLVKIEGRDDGTMQMTRDGSITGTPAYMSPEAALGQRELDGRSDIYSLGCVAYYLLSGVPVFDEPTPISTALAHVQQQPVPPSARVETSIPHGLEEVVMACLAKDPEHRIESAWELARRLESLTDVPRFCRDVTHKWWELHKVEQEMPSEVTVDDGITRSIH